MSQVIKKLENGGNPKKYGSLTIDGTKYDATPELIQALSQHFSGYEDSTNTYDSIISALRNNADLTYNSGSNTIYGMDGRWIGINSRQADKRKVGASDWRKQWQANFDTDAHRFRNALAKLGGFAYSANPTTSSSETPSNLTDIFGDRIWYNWKEDAEGNKSLISEDASNLGIKSRLDAFTDLLSMSEEDAKKKYKLADWYSPQRMAALRQLYKNTPDWKARIASLEQRAATGDLDENDIAFLNNFNIGEDDGSSSGSGLSKKDQAAWKNAGYESLINVLGGKAHLTDDGSLELNEGEDWGNYIGNFAQMPGAWFNDDFYNSQYGSDGRMNAYKGLTFYNGRLYGANNSTLARILNASGGRNELMKQGRWDDADKIIRSRWTEGAMMNPKALAADAYSNHFNGKNYRFLNVTGLKSLKDGVYQGSLPDGTQIIQYTDLDSNDYNGGYRTYNYKYALLDEDGQLLQDNITEDMLDNISGGTAQESLSTYKRVTGAANNRGSAYRGMIYRDFTGNNGSSSGFRMYFDPNNPDNVILETPYIKARGGQGKNIRLPKEIARILMGNKAWRKSVLSNPQKQKNFITLISSIVQSEWGNSGTINHLDDVRKLKDIGFTEEEAKQLKKLLYSYFNSAKKGDRQEVWLVDKPAESETPIPSNKLGGRLEHLPKLQNGATVGATTKSVGVSEERVADKKVKDHRNAAGIGEIGGKNWTDDDTADMVALAADLGSLGLAFAPGANIASAVTGAIGSTARLKADLGRGTKGAGWTYLMSLGMDAATLLPLLGGVVKSAKVAKTIGKSAGTLIRAASVFGLGSTFVNSVKKIASGEKWTVRDVSNVVNGLTAGVALGKAGAGAKKVGRGQGEVKPIELTKSDGTKLTLNEGAVNSIKNSAPKDKEALAKAIAEATGKELSEVKEFNLDSFFKPGGRKFWLFGKRGESQLEIPELKQTRGKLEPKEVEPNGKWFHDWWYGVGKRQQAFNQALTGQPVDKKGFLVKTKGGQKSTRQVWDGKSWKEVKRVEVPKETGQFLPASVRVSPGTNTPGNLLPAPISYQVMPVPARAMQSRVTLNPQTSTVTVTRGNGVKFNRKAYQEMIDLVRRQTATMPHFVNVYTDANYQRNRSEFPEYPGFVANPLYYKKGGVVKGYNGLSIANAALNDTVLTNGFSPIGSTLTYRQAIDQGIVNPTGKEQETTPETTPTTTTPKKPDGGASTQNPKVPAGGPSKAYREADLTMPGNALNMAFQIGLSQKQRDTAKSLPAYQQQAPLLNSPRFIDSGTGAAYQAAADKTRMYKPTTSDAALNEANMRAREADALNYELQGDLAESQERAKYQAGLDEFTNQNILRNTDIANANAQYRLTKQQQDVQADNAYLSQLSNFTNAFATTALDKYNKTRDARIAAKNSDYLLDKQDTMQAQITKLLNDYRTQYDTTEKQNSPAGQLAYQQIQNQIARKKSELEQIKTSLSLPYALAKGGKTKKGKDSKVTYSRDPYPEMLMESQKISAKFVEKLSDHAIKLILSVKPKYVS